MDVVEYPVQKRRGINRNHRLFLQLAGQRLDACLARVHPTAWKVPTREVAVPNEQDPLVDVGDNRLHPERQGPPEERAQL